jgi:hypothetical protein
MNRPKFPSALIYSRLPTPCRTDSETPSLTSYLSPLSSIQLPVLQFSKKFNFPSTVRHCSPPIIYYVQLPDSSSTPLMSSLSRSALLIREVTGVVGTGKSDTTGLSDDEEGGTSPLWVRSGGIYIYIHTHAHAYDMYTLSHIHITSQNTLIHELY